MSKKFIKHMIHFVKTLILPYVEYNTMPQTFILYKSIAAFIIILFVYSLSAHTCTMVVASGKITTDGRPVILKTRDESDEWRQEVKFFEAGGDRKYGHMSVVKWGFSNENSQFPSTITGIGVNMAGLAITNTTVLATNPLHEVTNSNMFLLNKAIETCANIADFEELLKNWHKIKRNSTVDGIFSLVDNEGGAAMFEITAMTIGSPLLFEKLDANTAVDDNGKFIGFVVRTNKHKWDFTNDGGETRRKRAVAIMNKLLDNNTVDYKSIMQVVSRDVCGNIKKSDNPDFDDHLCISRYNTRFGSVVRGIKAGEDKRLITMWVNLGEPSIGIYTPFFPFSKKVPLYAYADDLPENTGGLIVDENSASIMNNLIVNVGELSVYDNNVATFGLGKLTVEEKMDRRVDYQDILRIKKQVLPVENLIIKNTEDFLNNMREEPSYISEKNLYNFSQYAIDYAYNFYKTINDNSSTIHNWNYNLE